MTRVMIQRDEYCFVQEWRHEMLVVCTTVIYAVKWQFSISLRDRFGGEHMVVWCTTIYGISVDHNLKKMRCCNTLLLMSYKTLLKVMRNSWSPSENTACKILSTPFALLLLRHRRKTLLLVGLFACASSSGHDLKNVIWDSKNGKCICSKIYKFSKSQISGPFQSKMVLSNISRWL
jgi:hypothetical protein